MHTHAFSFDAFASGHPVIAVAREGAPLTGTSRAGEPPTRPAISPRHAALAPAERS
ncbi:hypothetical protein Sm713_30810 [Streptomyces sp. TS71-3]|nr:hypothetical protein Sm713_30810 [Streptomyces sp. TS71-3]